MKTVRTILELSEDVYTALSAKGFSKEVISKESRKLFALKCYRDKILSLGKAVELSGLSKWDFIEFLSENDVPVVAHNDVNLERESDAVESLLKDLKE